MLSGHWLGKRVLDIVGYGVQGVSELVLVCWWAGPKPSSSWGKAWRAVGRLQDSGFLLSASWWVMLVSRRVQVSYGSGGSQGFLEQDPALWWIELCLGPSGGQGHI